MSTCLDTSLDTSEMLDIAEKLVDDVEKKIVQVSFDIKNFQLDDDSYADESVLYIRDVVNAKFKELNRGILSLDNNYCSDENQIDYQHCNCEQRKNDAIKLPRVLILENNNKQASTNEEIKNSLESKPQSKIKVKKGTLHKTDSIKTQSSQSSLIGSPKVDLLPNDNDIIRKNNFNIPELKNDSCERKQKKENSVDTAVQTSIQEIPHDKPASFDRSPELLAEKNISNDSIRNSEINPETVNAVSSKEQHPNKTLIQRQVLNEESKKSKGSFIEFMCRIAELDANNLSDINSDDLIEENRNNVIHNKTTEIEIINEDFDLNEVSLYSPKFEHVDKILNNFDKKMKSFMENKNKFLNVFSRIALCNNDNNVNAKIRKSDKKENNFNEVKLSFKPQSTSLSSETTITSESLKPPKRFSTPLNNYSVNIETKNTYNDIEEHPTTPIIKFDINNDSKVFITRNKLSLSAAAEKKIESSDKIGTNDESKSELRSSKTLENSRKQMSEEIHSEECHDFSYNNTVEKLDCQQETETNNKILVNILNMNNQKLPDNKKKQFETKIPSLSNEKTLSKSVKLQKSLKHNQLQVNQNIEPDNLEINLVVDSSKDDLRDRTSFDVSAIYSESFETASFSENEITLDELKKVDDKIENFELNEENDGKFEQGLSIDREKKDINIYSDINKLNGGSQTSEEKKSISVDKNNYKQNSINQSNNSNLNLSVHLSTKSENRQRTSSSSLESYRQIQEKISSVGTLQEKTGKSSSDDYSEGELHLPISLGEVRVNGTPNSQENKDSNYYQNLTDHIHDILNSSLQSLGEILNSNVESTSSVTTHMTYFYQ